MRAARASAPRTSLATLALGGIMLLPLAEIALRKFFGTGIPGAGPFAQNLTLWVGLLGAAIAAREGKLLTLATGEFLPKGTISDVAHVIGGARRRRDRRTMFAVGGVALVADASARPATSSPSTCRCGSPTSRFPIAFALIAAAARLARVAARGRAARSPRSASSPASDLRAAPSCSKGTRCWPWLIAIARRRRARRADLRAARRHRDVRVLRRRQPADRPADQGLRGADVAVGQPRRDSAVHARPDSCSPKASRRNGCCARCARWSAGCRAARPSPPRRCARSSRCSPADRA